MFSGEIKGDHIEHLMVRWETGYEWQRQICFIFSSHADTSTDYLTISVGLKDKVTDYQTIITI